MLPPSAGPTRNPSQRWRDKLGLTEAEIHGAAEASRQEHPEPPDGPKALHRAIQRAGGAGMGVPRGTGQLELPPPKDVTEEGFGFGLEYVLLQRAALG